jgi:hypothetical protein
MEDPSLETLTWWDGQMEEPLFDRLHKFPVSIYEALATFFFAFGTVFAFGYCVSEFVLPEPEVLFPRELYFDQIELGQKAAPNGQDDFNCKLPQV